jgi:hypothetical protein
MLHLHLHKKVSFFLTVTFFYAFVKAGIFMMDWMFGYFWKIDFLASVAVERAE